MRVLKICSGIAVILTALHFAHAIHHFYTLESTHGAGLWAGISFAALIDLLALVGGSLLIRQP
jgi:hypothetical protein